MVRIFFIYNMENNEKLNFDATLYKSPEEWTGGQIDWQVYHCRVFVIFPILYIFS